MTGKGCKLLDCIPHSCLPSFGETAEKHKNSEVSVIFDFQKLALLLDQI